MWPAGALEWQPIMLKVLEEDHPKFVYRGEFCLCDTSPTLVSATYCVSDYRTCNVAYTSSA